MHRSQTVGFTVAVLWGLGIVTSLYLDGWEWAMTEVQNAVALFGMANQLEAPPLEYRSALVMAASLTMGWVGMSRAWVFFAYRILFLAAGAFMLATLAFSLASVGLLVETASAIAAAIGSFALAAWFSPTGSRRYRTLIRSGLSSGISRQRFEQVIDTKDFSLEPEQRDITAITLRLADPKSVEDACDSTEAWVGLLSYLKGEWHEFFRQQGGMILEETGISITAAFGVPLASLRHPRKACRVALALKDEMDTILAKVDEEVRTKLAFRLGIASGQALVGLLPHPGESWQRYSVVGAVIEESHRLTFGENDGETVTIILSPTTHEAVKDIMEFRPTDREDQYELITSR